MAIAADVLKNHNLTGNEYREICAAIGREPNEVELGIFSVMWSEHCSYKSSRVYLKRLPTKGKAVVQGPGENAGAIAIGGGLAVVFKMESHNHPSFIEPFQGAATGVGGILRDIFTMGARPIALLDSLRFGALDHPKTQYLMGGVVSGIAAYGNCMGIPTVGGEAAFDASFNGNILVNAMCVGIAPIKKLFLAKARGKGNPVIYVGSKTGRDGIHGATMASDTFGDGKEERRPTVQVGDPFTEKLLLEACLELMAGKDVVAIQDMGAAGLTCSTFEMAAKGGLGVEIDLAKVPRREEGMTPYDVMLSESQERMLIVGRQGSERRIEKIFRKWDLDVAVIGHLTGDGIGRIRDHGKVVAEIPVAPVVDGVPVYQRPIGPVPAVAEPLQLEAIPLPTRLGDTLIKLLGSPNIASKQSIFRQYDHMVGTDTVILPGSDAAVLRIKGTGGLPAGKTGLAMVTDCNSRLCYLDPYEGARQAVAEAARNISCSGGTPLAVTDCLNFGNPESPEVMGQFARAVEGIAEACAFFKTPVVSGNVSFYNETDGKPIWPTPTIGMVGLLKDVRCHTTQWFKEEGDSIILLGVTQQDLGGSEYLALCHGKVRGPVPRLDLDAEKKVQELVRGLIANGLVRSAHDCSEGGLAVALAESCISGPRALGVEITLDCSLRADVSLFAESPSRIVVSATEKDLPRILKSASVAGIKSAVLGRVAGTRFKVNDWVSEDVGRLSRAWKGVF